MTHLYAAAELQELLEKLAFSIRAPTNPVPSAPKLPMAQPPQTGAVAPPKTPTASIMQRHKDPAEKLAGVKVAAPRWVKEIKKRVESVNNEDNQEVKQKYEDYAVSAGNKAHIDTADNIAAAAHDLGLPARNVKLLGRGSETKAYLTAGNVTITGVNTPRNLFVTKVTPNAGRSDVGLAQIMGEKPRINELLSMRNRAPSVYGARIGPTSGIEFQEFLPYKAEKGIINRIADSFNDAYLEDMPGHRLRDIKDHGGNVRVNRGGRAKVLDALIKDLNSGIPEKNFHNPARMHVGEYDNINTFRRGIHSAPNVVRDVEPTAPRRPYSYRTEKTELDLRLEEQYKKDKAVWDNKIQREFKQKQEELKKQGPVKIDSPKATVPEKPELIEFTASKRGPSLKDLKAKVVQSATPKPEPSSVNVKTNFHEPPKLKPKVNKKLLAGLGLGAVGLAGLAYLASKRTKKRTRKAISKVAVIGALAAAVPSKAQAVEEGLKGIKAPPYREAVDLNMINLPKSMEYLQSVAQDPDNLESQFGKTTPFSDLILGRRLVHNAKLS